HPAVTAGVDDGDLGSPVGEVHLRIGAGVSGHLAVAAETRLAEVGPDQIPPGPGGIDRDGIEDRPAELGPRAVRLGPLPEAGVVDDHFAYLRDTAASSELLLSPTHRPKGARGVDAGGLGEDVVH